MPGFVPALAELDRVDRVHVEGAEVPEQVVHVVDAEPVVLDAVLVRRPAADVETRGRLVAAGDAGQKLERAKQVPLAQAGQHRDLLRRELDAADVVGGIEQRHLRDHRHVGRERRREDEVDAGAERPRDLNGGVVAGEIGQLREQDEPARRARGLEHIVAVAVRGRDQRRAEDPHRGAGETRSVGRLHGADDSHSVGSSGRGVLRQHVVGCGGRAHGERQEVCYGSEHALISSGCAGRSGSVPFAAIGVWAAGAGNARLPVPVTEW